MTRARSRRLALAALAATSALTLTACGTGFDATTNERYQPGVGANVREGDVQAYNAVLVANGDDSYTFSAGLLNTTRRQQQLSSYTIKPLSGSGATEGDPSVPVTLKGDKLTTIGYEGEIVSTVAGITVGKYAEVTLTFDDAGPVRIETPIVERTAEYSQIASMPGSADDEPVTPAEQGAEEAENVG